MSDFELVSKAAPATKFKIGDQVRCTSNSYGAVKNQGVTTVTGLAPKSSHFMSILNGNGFSYDVKNFELVKAYEQTPTTAVAEEAVEITNMSVNFRTTHFIDNTPIQDYTVGQQGDLIERLEKDIARLEAFGTKTKAIVKQIKELKADLKKVITQFDTLVEE